MRVLVIEDNSKLARLLVEVLEDEQIEVDLAHDGDIGLELALAMSMM